MSHSLLDATSSPDSVDRRVHEHLATQRARLGALYGTPAARQLSPGRSRGSVYRTVFSVILVV
jgi:hypothetical protein